MIVYSIGAAFLLMGVIFGGTLLWDELVDFVGGWKRRGHRPRRDVERTVRLRPAAARARARVPRQRGPRHRGG